MYPSAFRYERPTTLEGALAHLAEHGDEARPLAGGQSLIPLMKLRVVHPEVLVDLQDLPGGDRLHVDGGWLVLGPLTRHRQIERSPEVAQRLPVLVEGMALLADVQVRELGTVAGSVAEADPAGDWGPLLLAVGGEVTCTSRRGERVVDHEDLFVDYLTSAVEEDELITEIRLALPTGPRNGGAYLKLERRAGDFAVVSAAAQVGLDTAGRCRSIGVGVGGVGMVPMKAVEVERALLGTTLEPGDVEEAAALVDERIRPLSDGRGPDWYKRDMARVHVARAVRLAAARASGHDFAGTANGHPTGHDSPRGGWRP